MVVPLASVRPEGGDVIGLATFRSPVSRCSVVVTTQRTGLLCGDLEVSGVVLLC